MIRTAIPVDVDTRVSQSDAARRRFASSSGGSVVVCAHRDDAKRGLLAGRGFATTSGRHVRELRA